MTFKLKKQRIREVPKYLGIRFSSKHSGTVVFTMTSYDPIKATYKRNDGGDTEETPYRSYTEAEIEEYFKDGDWVKVN